MTEKKAFDAWFNPDDAKNYRDCWAAACKYQRAQNAADRELRRGDAGHVGDSAFECWYSEYNAAHKGDKQRARDAYAAGLGERRQAGQEAAAFGQFLSNVMTAAGLVEHGKQCKALGQRLADGCATFRTMLYAAPQPCHSQAPESAPQLSLSRTGATQAGQEPVAWMAHYTNKSGLQCVYTSSSYALAVENDVNSAPVPLYIAPPSTPVPDGRDAEIAALTAERDALRSRACR